MQSGTTTDVTRADRGTTAETGSGNLIVENAAVVDLIKTKFNINGKELKNHFKKLLTLVVEMTV